MTKLVINLTHDVDRVRKTFQYLTHDVRRGRFRNLRSIFSTANPYWMIPHILKLEDAHGVRSTFFMLQESIRPQMWSPKSWVLAFGRYKFSDPQVADAIRAMHQGGWEVGLHGSYNSYMDADLLRRERQALMDVLDADVIGIRQHYLNLEVPDTWRRQKEAGFSYDASFGFRRGIGWRDNRYRTFTDPDSGMVVIPLTLMEFNEFGLLSESERWPRCLQLFDEAEKNQAVLSVLWHQRVYNDAEFPGWGELYERIIVEGKHRGAQFMTCRELYAEYVSQAAESGA